MIFFHLEDGLPTMVDRWIVVGPPTPNGRTSWLKHGFVLITNWDDPPSKKSILPTNDPYAINKCHLAAAKNLTK